MDGHGLRSLVIGGRSFVIDAIPADLRGRVSEEQHILERCVVGPVSISKLSDETRAALYAAIVELTNNP